LATAERDLLLGCHRAFLLGSSEKFQAMMQFHNFQTNTMVEPRKHIQQHHALVHHVEQEVMTLNVFHPDVLPHLLSFIYTGTITASNFVNQFNGEVNIEVLLHLVRISDEYFIPALAKQCCELLCLFLSPTNVGEIFQYAYEHQLTTLRRIGAYGLLLILCFSPQPVSSILNFETAVSLDMEEGRAEENEKSHKPLGDQQVILTTAKENAENVDSLCRDFLNQVLLAIVDNNDQSP
jgi:hypothetical protein